MSCGKNTTTGCKANGTDTFRVIRSPIPSCEDFKPRPCQASYRNMTYEAPCNILGQPLRETDCIVAQKNKRNTGVTLSNVRTWMTPVSSVHTEGIPPTNEGPWWYHVTEKLQPYQPGYSAASTSRNDYQFRGYEVPGSTRFSAKPCYARVPAVGGAPVNVQFENERETTTVYREKISYLQGYDSRKDPNYPTRGKLEGSFICTRGQPSADTGNRNFSCNVKGAPSCDVIAPSSCDVIVASSGDDSSGCNQASATAAECSPQS